MSPKRSALVASAVVLAIAVPAAHATPTRVVLSNINAAVKGLQTDVRNLRDADSGQAAAIHRVDQRVDTLVANLATLTTKIDGSVAAATAAFASVNAALTNPTTGLVGLNNARPQYGAFTSTGAFIAGTGTVARGPSGNALGHTPAGRFVIDFGNDVSTRFLVVNPFPGAGSSGFPQATVCSLTDGTQCQAAQGSGAPDRSPNHVLVLFGTAGATAPANGFAVAALSG